MNASDSFAKAAQYINNKQYANAVDWLNKAEQEGNCSFELYFHRGACHYNIHDYQTAISDLEKAITLSPENSEAAFLLGNAYYNSGRFEEAIENYSRSFYYNPEHYRAVHWRLLARIQLKDANGKIINHEAAQHDADILLPVSSEFFKLTSKEGKPLEIVKIELGEDGTLNFKVNQ